MSGRLRPAYSAEDGGDLPATAAPEPFRLVARLESRAELERALLQLIPSVRGLLFRMLGRGRTWTMPRRMR